MTPPSPTLSSADVPVLSRIAGQETDHRGSGGGAVAYRCGEPQQFIPRRRDMTQCDRFGRHAGKQGAGFLAGKEVRTTLLDVAQARREAVAEEGHKAEHMVRCTACIGVVLLDCQAGLDPEEHTSELQSLMRISYAVFCLKKNIHKTSHRP